MRIIEIQALHNGAHRNQNGFVGVLPEGWAVIPEDIALENFPFGTVEAEEIDGVMTVTGWTAGEKPEPAPEPEPEPTVWDELDAAYQEGVDSV